MSDNPTVPAGKADLLLLLASRDTIAGIRETIYSDPARVFAIFSYTAGLTEAPATITTSGASLFRMIRRASLRQHGMRPVRKGRAGGLASEPCKSFDLVGLLTDPTIVRTTAAGEEKIGATWAEVLAWAHKDDPRVAILEARRKARALASEIKTALEVYREQLAAA